MSFDFPTLNEIIQRIQNDVQNELPESNPFLLNSFLRAMVTSYGGRFEEFYVQFQVLFDAIFLDSTSGEFVDRWGSIFGFSRLAASSASGDASFEGTSGTVIPIDTSLQGTNSVVYETQAEVTLGSSSFTGVSASIAVDTVTVTVTQNNHGLRDSQYINVISGSQPVLNGNYDVTVVDNDTFTYVISPGTPGAATLDFSTEETITFKQISGTVSGIIVTITQTNHGFATGISVVISTASDEALNGTFVVTVADANTFTYTTTGALAGATGPLNVSWKNGAIVSVLALTSGVVTNLDAGPQLSLTSAITGVDPDVYVAFGGITGGTDVETDDSFRQRVLARLENPIAEFSSSSIIEAVKILKLSDQTVVVSPLMEVPIAPSPAPGEVVVIVVIVETGTNTIRNPSTSELDSIKSSIETITPANIVSPVVGTDNVIVQGALSLVDIDVEITSLVPSTDSMQAAIIENLKAYFVDNVTISQNGADFIFTKTIQYNQINAIIQQTIDPDSASQPDSFSSTINAGTIDISIPTHNRAVLGEVTYV